MYRSHGFLNQVINIYASILDPASEKRAKRADNLPAKVPISTIVPA